MLRQLKGPAGLLLSSIAVICSLYHLYTGFFGIPEAYLHRVTHVTFLIALSLMCYPARGDRPTENLPWYDVLFLIGWMVSMGYIYYHYDRIIDHIGYTESFTVFEKVLAFLAIVVVLETCRRVIGWPLTLLAIIVVMYAFAGPYMPGLFFHLGYSASVVVDNQYFLTDGLFGLPTHISATYIFLFIVFGAFLGKSGFGQFTIDVAMALAGRLRGGPAQIAVLSSGLMGSISGSSTANAVVTGSFTIPMMKKAGFKASMAAAVEAAASTGGLIMPPVMASVGFLMAQFTGISYVSVMKLILLPALLYFLSIGIMVHIYAVREKLPIMAKEDLPNLKALLVSRGHLVLPLAILLYLLVSGRSPMYSVSYCILVIVGVSFFRKETRMGPRDIWEALEQGSIQATLVATAIITSSVMVGIFDLTGIAIKFSGLIVDITGGNLLLALFLIMISTIVLGMGLPLSSAYIVQVGIAIPALFSMGIEVAQAHLFVIFFSAFSAITPPTAPTTYAAAAIARSPIMPTAIEAMKLALPAFILPYMFVANISLLMVGSPATVAATAAFALAGIIAMAIALQNYAFAPMNPAKRAIFFLSGLALIGPRLSWNLAGMLVAGGLFAYQMRQYGNRNPENTA